MKTVSFGSTNKTCLELGKPKESESRLARFRSWSNNNEMGSERSRVPFKEMDVSGIRER